MTVTEFADLLENAYEIVVTHSSKGLLTLRLRASPYSETWREIDVSAEGNDGNMGMLNVTLTRES